MKTDAMIERDLHSSDIVKVTDTMLYITNSCKDLDWAENIMIKMFETDNKDVNGLALSCLGNLARIHGAINKEKVIPFLKKVVDENIKGLSGRAEDALDDIYMFAKNIY